MASSRSRPLPCGTPSRTSISTTLASSFDAIQWAAVAPTLPAPTIVTFLRMEILPVYEQNCLDCGFLAPVHHVVNHVSGKLTGLYLGSARHLALKIVRDKLLRDGGFE